jgi:hypothetical protein
VLEPDPEDIDLLDIAQSLARLCRFNGHVRPFFSVAEHSVEVAKLMEFLHPNDVAAFRWGLLHDAPEAFIGDIPRPVKRQLSGVKEMEEGLMKAVAECYGLPYPCPWGVTLKQCDTRALLWEAEAFMPSRGKGYQAVIESGMFELVSNPLLGYQETTIKAAKELFLDAFQHGGTTGRSYAFSYPSRN